MSEQAKEKVPSADLLRLTAEVVASYVRNNPLPTADLPNVITAIHNSLSALDGGDNAQSEPLKPAVPIRKSVMPDYIVCLDDGKKLKMLKRHLRTTYNITPEEYRARWGLGPDYPMVAPNYAKQRSEFAKQIGLGRASQARNRPRKRAGKKQG
jgi:predicted transcriptional regulator